MRGVVTPESLHAQVEALRAEIERLGADLVLCHCTLREVGAERDRYRAALERLRDCDWVISLPDRMDAVREIARKALEMPPS